MAPFFLSLLLAASPADTPQPAEAHARANQAALVRELVDALSIPDVAADKPNIRRKAEFLRGRFDARGFTTEILETVGNPLVLAEMKAAGATRTLLLYAHYDGQPVDPKGWKQESPFKPILRNGKMDDGATEIPGLGTLAKYEDDWRIYGRSASDDTSPIIAILAAVDAMKAAKSLPTWNLKVILDGEEVQEVAAVPEQVEPRIPGIQEIDVTEHQQIPGQEGRRDPAIRRQPALQDLALDGVWTTHRLGRVGHGVTLRFDVPTSAYGGS